MRPCHGRSSAYTGNNTASEENALSLLPYRQSDQIDQLSFSPARSISRARALDFKFTQDCTAVNVPFPGGGTPRKIGWGCAARFPKPLPYL